MLWSVIDKLLTLIERVTKRDPKALPPKVEAKRPPPLPEPARRKRLKL